MATSTNFGRDTSCTDTLRTGRFVSGVRLVGEALYRRLTTPRGTLRGGDDEANYGLDLLDFIGSVNTTSDATALAGQIRSEASKDERIESVNVVVTLSDDGAGKAIGVAISVQTAAGPFSMQIAVNAVSAELIGITPGGI